MSEGAPAGRRSGSAGTVWLTAVITAVSLLAIQAGIARLSDISNPPPRVYRGTDGGITIGALNGPFVITHDVAKGESPFFRAVAPLPAPVAYIESGRLEISAATLNKLTWYEANSKKPVDFPFDVTYSVLYLRAEYSETPKESGQ